MTIGVIFLFIGLAAAPSVTADSRNISLTNKSPTVNYKQLLKVILNLKNRIESLSSYMIDNTCGCKFNDNSTDYPRLLCFFFGIILFALVGILLFLEYVRINESPDSDIFYIIFSLVEKSASAVLTICDLLKCPFIHPPPLNDNTPLPTILPYL